MKINPNKESASSTYEVNNLYSYYGALQHSCRNAVNIARCNHTAKTTLHVGVRSSNASCSTVEKKIWGVEPSLGVLRACMVAQKAETEACLCRRRGVFKGLSTLAVRTSAELFHCSIVSRN